jgi:hypothetical protein
LFGHRQADKSEYHLTPVAEQEFQFQDINAFEYAMKSRLAGGTRAFEAEPPQPVMRVVAAPIRDGRLTCAAAHHSDAAKQENRQEVITFAFSLSKIGKK